MREFVFFGTGYRGKKLYKTFRHYGIEIKYWIDSDNEKWNKTLEGKYIYHAGDLNLWKWDGAGDLVNGKEARAFRHEINKLSDYEIDVAFVPLDSRQKKFAAEGLLYFMEHVDAKAVFPMHMWQDYSYIGTFKSKISNGAFARRLVEISGENEVYEL